MNGSSPTNPPEPSTNGTLYQETKQHSINNMELIPSDITAIEKPMYENRTDDEKTGSLQMAAKMNPYSNPLTSVGKEQLLRDSEEKLTKLSLQNTSDDSRFPVEETVEVTTATTAQSAAASRMDGLFLKLEEDEGSFASQTRYSISSCVAGATKERE